MHQQQNNELKTISRNVETSEIDPYKVLNLDYNFTEEELKTALSVWHLNFIR